MMAETALKQIEYMGFWLAGAATAINDWKYESDDIRHMLHGLVDHFLDDGDECSSALTAKPFGEVWDDMVAEAHERGSYPEAFKEQD